MPKEKDNIKPCPCGDSDIQLGSSESRSGCKWANVYADCCGEWFIEFRTGYHQLDSAECAELALEAWNAAPRGRSQLDKT